MYQVVKLLAENHFQLVLAVQEVTTLEKFFYACLLHVKNNAVIATESDFNENKAKLDEIQRIEEELKEKQKNWTATMMELRDKLTNKVDSLGMSYTSFVTAVDGVQYTWKAVNNSGWNIQILGTTPQPDASKGEIHSQLILDQYGEVINRLREAVTQ